MYADAGVAGQVRKVMAEDPAQAKRLLGSLDIRLLPPKAVADLVLELATNTEHKVEWVLKPGVVAALATASSAVCSAALDTTVAAFSSKPRLLKSFVCNSLVG
jgi:hypothetical protein